MVGWDNDVSEKELPLCEELSKRVKEKQLPLHENLSNNLYYARFVRARDFSIEAAWDMLERNIKWRIDSKVIFRFFFFFFPFFNN